MKLKYFILIFIFIISAFFLSGCYDNNGLENLAYVVAIGIDQGEENTIKLSLQFANLNQSGNSESSSQSSSSSITAVECSTIDSGISLINSYISKRINLSHCKAIVISETLAYTGISDYIFTLVNNIQIRPECNIIISRCDAYELLKNSTPILESVSARYYELILNSSEYTAYTEDATLADFYESILSTTSEPIAILGGINTKASQKQASEGTILDDNYKADETPIDTSNNMESMGLAVFRKDKLVGELTNIETLCHLIVSNELKSATITIPNPYNSSSTVSLYIDAIKKTKNSVNIINTTPYISTTITINSYILSLDDKIDSSNQEHLDALEKYLNAYLEEKILSYLYKTSKELNTDIDNFGRLVLSDYLTWEDWISSDWLNNYKNSFFDVKVNSNVFGSYLYSKF